MGESPFKVAWQGLKRGEIVIQSGAVCARLAMTKQQDDHLLQADDA